MSRSMSLAVVFVGSLSLWSACGGDAASPDPSDTETGIDTDTGVDTETGSDVGTEPTTDETPTDSDTPSETDTGSDLETETASTPSTDTVSDEETESASDAPSDSQTETDSTTESDTDTDTETDSDSETETVLDGFGAISGECGVIDAALLDAAGPAYIENGIDFGAQAFSVELLSPDAQEVYDSYLGDDAATSTAIAFDVLHRCELATLLKTQDEILYDGAGSTMDILADLHARKVGVEVVKAYAYPPEATYSEAQAEALLTNALTEIQESTALVSDDDAWSAQILFVLAYTSQHASALAAAYTILDADLQGETIVYVTITAGDDGFLY